MVNYAWAGWSQRKLWWRLEAILTCKSIVGLAYRGDRLIEPSSSWFPSKYPSGSLRRYNWQFHRVERMIRGIGDKLLSTYSQTTNRWWRWFLCWTSRTECHVSSGPFLVSRTGDAGWTESWAKVPNTRLEIPQKESVDEDSRAVALKVGIR